MISNLDPLAGTQPQLPFVRPIGDDHVPQSGFETWGTYIVARLGSEFQIGEFLIRRVRADQFVIWNAEAKCSKPTAPKWNQRSENSLTTSFETAHQGRAL